jgi:phthalate 4,5-cis-dihydrodiol dehydrogenase
MNAIERPVRLGVAGLGQGAAGMIPAMNAMPEIELVGGADLNATMREGFARLFPAARVYDSVAALCADPNVDAVYVGTPNRFHCEHAIEAMRHGKHAVVEKPMAITLDEADRMVEVSKTSGVTLLAAHTRSYGIWTRAMRRIALSGDIGPVRAIHVSAYTDWMLRPRTADELDPNQGGGVPYRQGPHQIDTVRLLGGGLVRSVRGSVGKWMSERPVAGYYTAFLEFEDGTPATIMHNGYGYYSMRENYPWVATRRDYSAEDRAEIRRALRDGTRAEETEKEEFRIGGARDPMRTAEGSGARDWSPFDLGPVEVICERGFVRNARHGLVVYDEDGRHDVDLSALWRPEPDPSGGLSIAVLEELYGAVVLGRPVYHGAEWGRATLEVALAMIQSSEERREIVLSRQVPMPPDYDAHLLDRAVSRNQERDRHADVG